ATPTPPQRRRSHGTDGRAAGSPCARQCGGHPRPAPRRHAAPASRWSGWAIPPCAKLYKFSSSPCLFTKLTRKIMLTCPIEKLEFIMFNIAVVGLGGIGNNHARCYAANEHTQVVAVCDILKDRADKAAE